MRFVRSPDVHNAHLECETRLRPVVYLVCLSRMAVPPFVLSNQAVSRLHTPEEDNGDESYHIENDQEIKQRLAAERARLRKIAGLAARSFPPAGGSAFTAEQRSKVTILFGGFTGTRRFDPCGIPGLRLSLKSCRCPTSPHSRSERNMATTASATRPISLSAT